MSHSILVHLLACLRAHPPDRGENPSEAAERWIQSTPEGEELVAYLKNEAGLVAMAANRLHLMGDEELREIAVALGSSAERLWDLVGTPQSERE